MLENQFKITRRNISKALLLSHFTKNNVNEITIKLYYFLKIMLIYYFILNKHT